MTLMRAGRALETVRDWIRWTATRLSRADLHYGHGTDEPWDEAVALVAGWLRIPPDRLGDMLDARLTEDERDAIGDCVAQRIEDRVPVPYLTGRAWLAGVEFEVDARVLVPRSPIAFLLGDGLQPWLGERNPLRILDLCTGSGCLGILAALAFPDAELVLADLSADALEVARRNVARHGLDERSSVLLSDGFDGVASDGVASDGVAFDGVASDGVACDGVACDGVAPDDRFDLILCNPPYVNAVDLAAMPAEFAHEPQLALAGGSDGLELVARLLPQSAARLSGNGLLVLELGNSAAALAERFPQLAVSWPELTQGGTGVALIEAADLVAAFRA